MKSVFDYFAGLYRDKGQIILLTWCYSTIAIVFVLIAGIFALISQPIGAALLIIPLIAIAALCANIAMWALIRFAIESVAIRRKRFAARLNKPETDKTVKHIHKGAEVSERSTKNSIKHNDKKR